MAGSTTFCETVLSAVLTASAALSVTDFWTRTEVLKRRALRTKT
jgi:hypothetical protein